METELESIAPQCRLLMDRTAIADCIAMHARGCDRHDVDLITAAYRSGRRRRARQGDEYGVEYGNWANHTHAATSQVHTHSITTHTCQIDGDTADAESYVTVVLLGARRPHRASSISGRYIDRLERRDGQWRIEVRRSTVEVMFSADACGTAVA